MADENQVVRGINWREAFPFTHLFRAFRIAIHPSKLMLGLLLILILYMGGRILDSIWPEKFLPAADSLEQYEAFRWRHAHGESFNAIRAEEPLNYAAVPEKERLTTAMGTEPFSEATGPRRGIFDEFFTYEATQVSAVVQAVLSGNWLGDIASLNQPLPSVVRALSNFTVVGPGWLVRYHCVYAIFFGCLFLLVWAVFGGAIARIAAVHVARDEKISIRQALGFSASKTLSFIFAPLIPLIIIVVAGLAVAAGGLLFYIPWVGPIVAACLFIFSLLAGFIMTLVATGMIGGMNLMYPTVAVEGSDSFDAISRSFSYVFARPWRMLFYTAVSLVYGSLCYLFVRWFIYVMLSLTHYFVRCWLGGQAGAYFPAIWPQPHITSLIYQPDFTILKWSESLAAGILCFWIYLVITVLGAFVISFYFSANTIIYYLMRQEVDATELDDVYVEETDEEFVEATVATAVVEPATPPPPASQTPAPAEPPPIATSSEPGIVPPSEPPPVQ